MCSIFERPAEGRGQSTRRQRSSSSARSAPLICSGGLREILENFCEKLPEMCTLLERPAEAKGPEHETAKEFLECPERYPSFAEAASGTGATTLIAKRGERVRAFLLRISSTPVTAWQLRLLY